MKYLIIGDIHSCYDEMQQLLAKAGLNSDDQIIALGDIVDRGPDSVSVVEFFRSNSNARSLLGNHEHKHILIGRALLEPSLSQVLTHLQVGDNYYGPMCAFMEEMPTFIELEEAILVHGYLEPGIPLEQQKEPILIGSTRGGLYLKHKYSRPWYELYDGSKPVIVGHRNYAPIGRSFIYQDRVFAIDTKCYAGGALTGIVLPDFRLVSVPSRGNHWSLVQARYPRAVSAFKPVTSVTWIEIEQLITWTTTSEELLPAIAQRIENLKSLYNAADAWIADFVQQVHSEHSQLMDSLQHEFNFSNLDSREQARIYAEAIADRMNARFLHWARKGSLSEERVRGGFIGPAKALDYALSLKK